MTLPYAPTTDHGRGFLPLMVRAFGHALFVAGAHFNKWPMTVEDAKAELTEALNHVNAIGSFDMLSTSGRASLDDWKNQINLLIQVFGTVEAKNPDALANEHRTQIIEFTHQTYALLAILDIELLGLRETETDAGRAP